MTSDELRIVIEREAEKRGIAPATLCRKAVGNQRLHRTLLDGRSCTLEIADRFQKYIAANPVADTQSAA